MRWSLLSNTNAEAGPSKRGEVAGGREAEVVVPTVNRYETILKDEERYQEMQYTTNEEVPSCMTLFDDFMMCYALVPQLRSFYRHGEFRDCTWKFQDFKYCLSLKSEDPEAKRKLWIKRRAEWWAARRVAASSEDVWDVRTEPLKNFPPLHQEEIPLDQTAT